MKVDQSRRTVHSTRS